MNTDKIELYCQNLSSEEALMLINYISKIDAWYASAEPLDDNHGVADETKIDMVLSHTIGYNRLFVNVKLIDTNINKTDDEVSTPEYLGIKFTLDFKLDPEEDHLEVHSDKYDSEYITHDEWNAFKDELISSLNHHMEVLKFNKINRLNPEDVDNTVVEETKEETDDVQ